MKAECPRLFEVEAMRDGRLTGAEVARFRTHMSLCAACARELRALEAVAVALRAPERAAAPLAETDELRVRRRRTRLLAAFDATLVPEPRHALAKLAPVWVATLGALCMLGAWALAVRHWPATAVPAAVLDASDPVGVRADSTARWSRRVENQLEKIRLEDGTLAIRVDHARSARRLLVLLPDGELEDIGTAFTVSVHAGRTARVAVQDGSVVLRLSGAPPLDLNAGEAWTPDSAAPLASAVASVGASPPSSPSAVPGAASSSRVRSKKTALGGPAAVPQEVASARDPAADFRAALSALNAGDPTGAAARFAAFSADHPRDPRAEDAAYLRVIALHRTGDAVATQRAAHEYLRRYPHGFRHAEVASLVE